MSNFVAATDGSNLAHRHRIFTDPAEFKSYMAVSGELFFLICDGNLFIALGNGVCPGGVARARLYNGDLPLDQTPDASANTPAEAQDVIDAICADEEMATELADCIGAGSGTQLPAGTRGQFFSYNEEGDIVASYLELDNIVANPDDYPVDTRYIPTVYVGPDGSETTLVSVSSGNPVGGTSPLWGSFTQDGTSYAYLRGDVPPDDVGEPAGGDDVLVNRGWVNDLVDSRVTEDMKTYIDQLEPILDPGTATTGEVALLLNNVINALQGFPPSA